MAKLVRYQAHMPRFGKGTLALLADALMCPIASWLAFYLRLGEISGFGQGFNIVSMASLAIALPIFYFSNLYRVILRHATWTMLIDIVRSMFIYGVLFALIFAVMGVPGVPRTIGLIQPMLLFLGVGCSRAIVGYWLGSGFHHRKLNNHFTNVLIYGAGASGRQLASAIAYSGTLRVTGFVDDLPSLQGRRLGNITIHNPEDLRNLVEQLEVEEVLLAIPSAPRARRNQVIKMLYGLKVRVRTLPGLMDLASGRVQVSDIRPIEIEDLLGRDTVAPDSALLRHDIAGKTVLVTGAGGSIGSELCRQILHVGPTTLLLVENSEYALYSIHQDLLNLTRHKAAHSVSIIPLLASVRDDRRMDEIIGNWRPDTVYHAAAYKHVPLVEHNPAEGILNNVVGTLTTAKIASNHGTSKFVLISTDKAVRPTNIMGASKRIAEMVLQALAQTNTRTCFTMVRFGNVLGSSGSVVPLFRKQISDGGPITITHRDINRYFMTIPEASQLVIQAGAMAKGGEVFVLDMGEAVKIIDLAKNMIELSGLTVRDRDNPEGDIDIKEVGLRPGEKLFEELLIGNNPEPTPHNRIMKANEHRISWEEISLEIDRMISSIECDDVHLLKAIIHNIVPEFNSTSDIVDLVTIHKKAANHR
ncbi:nucleoside-diphosphate sugar epimerase/dehydratase [Sphingomonas sp. C3-2]|uniref:polysaccharide biosynthesis protein n=1 Tax=Sphingomonas sp. C3-2 TaxID=3062169 RepID=UPI00294B7CB9|nr:nucleoside-diphosphate sugar epimerase/dehydratase [Sphingomonas sp. C3-2]WOK35111.1 nucleoside-diphosphate sugar epimerase/dehydratase [Sphingomonas sp. C3-2]